MLTRSQVNLTESGTLKPQESRTITLQTTYLVRKIILSRCGGVNNIHLSNYRRSLINRKQYHFWNCALFISLWVFFSAFFGPIFTCYNQTILFYQHGDFPSNLKNMYFSNRMSLCSCNSFPPNIIYTFSLAKINLFNFFWSFNLSFEYLQVG